MTRGDRDLGNVQSIDELIGSWAETYPGGKDTVIGVLCGKEMTPKNITDEVLSRSTFGREYIGGLNRQARA